jgi:phosphoglycolate phosphatase-like HAD superfamily hydrolase
VSGSSAVIVDLDRVLGDTRPLWDDWLADAASVLDLPPEGLPADRGEAAALLDAGGAGNWRTLLQRFAEDRAPVYLRPAAEASAAMRRLAGRGTRIVLVTDAPSELAAVAASQLGASRHAEAIETGSGALERARSLVGGGAAHVQTRPELVALATGE